MNNFSKVLVGSSLVLGVALFSMGCGGNSSCCTGNDVIAQVNLLGANNLTNGNTLPLNVNTLNVNGMGSSSDGTITKAVWTVYEDCTKDTMIDTKTVTTKGAEVELDLGEAGTHKVCIVVTDTNGNSDEDCKCITVQENNGPTADIDGLSNILKAGCPISLNGANSVSHSGSNTIQSYVWTLDGTTVSTVETYALPDGLTAGSHEICLTVTDSNQETHQRCETKVVQPHSNPVAVLNVSHDNIDVADEGTLYFNDTLNLTCAGSHDDCPEGNRNIPQNESTQTGTCDFNGQSWQSEDATCQTPPPAGVVYINGGPNPTSYFYQENCRLTGEVNQVNTTSGSVSVSMCGQPLFNCVKFWVDVTDNFGGTARAEKTFKVTTKP